MTKFVPGRAVIVAISGYPYVDALPRAVLNDASDIASTLGDPKFCGYDPSKIHMLMERDATRDNILRAIDQNVESLTRDEPFFFFFSGHGDRHGEVSSERSYLLGYQATLDDHDVTAISDADLVERLDNLPSYRQVVILDACHAGGMGTIKAARGRVKPKGIGASAPQNLSSGRGRVIFTSCRSDEVAVVLDGARNSVFTTSILRGLQGAARSKDDGTIGIFDLFDYVADDVASRSFQHPIFKTDNLETNFSVARGTPRAQNSPALPPAMQPIDDVVQALSELYPLGPMQGEIWARAGGDVSRLVIVGQGRTQWFSALRLLRQGGGGTTERELLEKVLDEYPGNTSIKAILQPI
ncbi:peptidase C14 caspase catalytic subunit p20 [Rhizobium sp. CF080]|uniref:caspase family protein n=1 Tax=Rhizobium sp. (strain CF080) TaxID=1144310 RepID=UPI0002718119|nr:caspase family protein [Rhizobium sp. CF080]EUC00054.1 peptidase C14 caspase catalytic subunit p20 [Rhizobium sp. CF080]